MNHSIKQIALLITITVFLLTAAAKTYANDNWFVRPYIGLSQMSDQDTSFSNVDMLSGNAEISLNNGFTSGLGLGYRYTDNIAIELAWEYRSNDSETVLDNQSTFEDGNYAANLFFANVHYHFNTQNKWQPYLGIGLSWAEEIDIDLERNGEELSFSSSGETGFQLFGGLEYQLNDAWALQSELRYGSISGIRLESEEGNGMFEKLDYKTTTLQVGVIYEF